jgi:Short C-terminal domain
MRPWTASSLDRWFVSHALLKKLAELRDSGVLTDEELPTQKARLLNS